MKHLMITAAALALTGPAFAQIATPTTEAVPGVETMPAEGMGAGMMSPENPGISASWFEDRAIYTTNQPSTTMWDENADWGTERTADWNQIGEVDDVVLSADGQVMGYTADIGGFLGLGERKVLLSPEAVRLVDFDEATLWGDTAVFATNYTQEELEALPEFDDDMILDD